MFLDLSGKWNLFLDAEKKGIENKYFEKCSYDKMISLPGSVSQQKLSPKTEERAAGFLTDPYKYEGYAWYNRKVHLENLDLTKIYTLILERTRLSSVWIDGKNVGNCNSLNGFHEYNITDFVKEDFELTVLISNVNYPTGGGHLTSPDTQTNWNGIVGKIGINIQNECHLTNTKIYTEVASDSTILKIKTNLTGQNSIKAEISIENVISVKEEFASGNNEICITMPEDIKKWSDTDPVLYDLKFSLENGEAENYKIGFRSFKAVNTHFECNGEKVFLRGKHDGMIFPETGFAPADKNSWLKVMKTAREYGINHYRFHTCCPPEAAFEAADELGIYMSPELPFWGTIQAENEEGFNKTEQDYLVQEGFNILNCFGNHPSFVMMSMGNELWGSEKRLDDIMKAYHDYDDRHLYTGGSNNFQFWPRTTEHEDYFVGVRFAKDALIRGSYAQCDAPLGFVQTDRPNTNHSYDEFFNNSNDTNSDSGNNETEIEIQYGTGVKKVKTAGESVHFVPNKPCISHEVGQYCAYPNFEENKRFTGVLQPYNFEIFKERLEQSGMLNQADDFFKDSSKLQSQCYKMEIEAALRSNELSGFQLLDIQDFTGQGTAVVGVLNAFMESKGIVTGEQWRNFCDETVLLASFEKFVYQENEELSAEIILHNYSKNNLANQFVTAYIVDTESDEILCEESFIIPKNERGNQNLGCFKYNFEKINEYKKLALLLILQKDEESPAILNSYIFHVYPKIDLKIKKLLDELKLKNNVEFNDILITKDAKEGKNAAMNGKKVLIMPEKYSESLPGACLSEKKEIQTVEGTYCTDFWCYPMFRSISESMNKPVPVGTLGLTIKNKDKLFSTFPTDSYTTAKWYNIISHSQCVNVKNEVEPVIQMIDNVERNWKLGLLYKCEGCLILTSRLWEISEEVEVIHFLKSILTNM